jgi:hypothetical protein
MSGISQGHDNIRREELRKVFVFIADIRAIVEDWTGFGFLRVKQEQ